MRARQAVILFVRDEHEEARAKPLPKPFRSSGYRSINRSIAERLTPAVDADTDFIIATDASPIRPGQIRQRGRTFGERITGAIEDAFALGYDRVVAVGNDCPTIMPSDITAAFGTLRNGAALVAAPARDGGAFLVGAASEGFDPGTFEELPWQTADLFAAFTALPGAAPLAVVREDHDRWLDRRARAALRALLALPPRPTLPTPLHTPPVRFGTLRKALTRSFLPAPPLA
jgi:hypothetical protein